MIPHTIPTTTNSTALWKLKDDAFIFDLPRIFEAAMMVKPRKLVHICTDRKCAQSPRLPITEAFKQCPNKGTHIRLLYLAYFIAKTTVQSPRRANPPECSVIMLSRCYLGGAGR